MKRTLRRTLAIRDYPVGGDESRLQRAAQLERGLRNN